MPAPRSKHSGFSLLELSIVMAIVSVVAVLGLESIALFMNRTAYRTTQERMLVIKTALAKHRYVYGYLPCPAPVTGLPTQSTYGKEIRSGANCNASTLVANVSYGDLPARDLQLPLSYMKDAYGTKLRYVVTNEMTIPGTSAGQFGNVASVGRVIVRTGKIEQPCSTACQQIAAAAYTVLSFGLDKRGKTAGSCVPAAAPTLYDGMIDSVNCRFTVAETIRINGSGAAVTIPQDVFYDSRYNNGSVEQLHFDDIILWQTKSQL